MPQRGASGISEERQTNSRKNDNGRTRYLQAMMLLFLLKILQSSKYWGCLGSVFKGSGWQSFDRQFKPNPSVYMAVLSLPCLVLWPGMLFPNQCQWLQCCLSTLFPISLLLLHPKHLLDTADSTVCCWSCYFSTLQLTCPTVVLLLLR